MSLFVYSNFFFSGNTLTLHDQKWKIVQESATIIDEGYILKKLIRNYTRATQVKYLKIP